MIVDIYFGVVVYCFECGIYCVFGYWFLWFGIFCEYQFEFVGDCVDLFK